MKPVRLLAATVVALSLLFAVVASAAREDRGRQLRPSHLKIREGGLKGRQDWWRARHGGGKGAIVGKRYPLPLKDKSGKRGKPGR